MRLFFSILTLAGVLAAQQQPSQADVEKMKAAAKSAVEQSKPAQPQQQPGQPQPQAPAPQQQPGQPQAPAPQQSRIMTMGANEVVATVDGQPVTAGALRAVVGALAPAQQQQALANQKQLLQQYGMMRRLAAEAEKSKLDQMSPYREALEMNRLNVLAQAQIARQLEQTALTEDEVKAHYDKNQLNFQQARVKAIYIPFGTAAPQNANAPKPLAEAEAKAVAAEVVKQARAGVDFVKLVKEHSKDANSAAKDGDFGTVARNAPIPEHIKAAIFSAKPGDVTEPVRQPNGFYVFRIEEIKTAPLDEVKSGIIEELKNTRLAAWFTAQQNSIKIEEQTSSAAPPKAAPAK